MGGRISGLLSVVVRVCANMYINAYEVGTHTRVRRYSVAPARYHELPCAQVF